MNPWHTTDGLITDRDGGLWLVRPGRDGDGPAAAHRLGPIADSVDEVPARLLGEYEEHLDLWLDSIRGDEGAEREAIYREQQGF